MALKTSKTSKPLAKHLPKPKLTKVPKPEPVSITNPKPTKQAYLISLLQQPEGQTVQDLVEALSWQSHTVRAAITRLRQAGYEITRSISENNQVLYHLRNKD